MGSAPPRLGRWSTPARSVALLDIEADALHEVAAALGDLAFGRVVDITAAEAVAAAVNATVEHFGDIDAVIANAGSRSPWMG